ncbi:MAG: hypothetical protein ACTHJK_14265 [Sphingomicrobium sp.]
MRIAAQATFSAIEQALRAIGEGPADDPLRLPTNLRHLVGGAETALAQAVVTWAQAKQPATLETFATSEARAEDFVRRLPGLAAALSSDEVIDVAGQTDSGRLKSAALKRLDQLQGPRARLGFRGSSAEIVCADHLGRDSPYLLYLPDQRGGSRLRPRENFRDLARWLIQCTVPREYLGLFDPEASDALGAMLYEMFKNTQDHALVDAAGNLLDVSIRAIKTNHHAVTPEALARIVDQFPPLAGYCGTLTPPAGAAQTHLFELSVLDSGPGFAATWTGTAPGALPLDREEEAVRACFASGSAKGQSRFGEGLPHVLRILSRQRGFLRLRTGRLSFYVDFAAETQPAEGSAVLRRFDGADSPALANVAGSLLTILIPMRRDQ